VALHERFGEGLAGLEAGSGLRGAEDTHLALLEGVDETEGERNFGAYDGECGLLGLDYGEHGLEAVDVDGDAAGDLGDSSIARSADNFGYFC
jgi:hypothetical protein